MTFVVTGVDPTPFIPLYGLPDDELAARCARRVVVGPEGGVPERVELRDMLEGEVALLVNYTHQPAATPYRASHAIYVREGATVRSAVHGTLPDVMQRRLLSLRAFDRDHMMLDAEVIEGRIASSWIERAFARTDVAYLHAHYARPGCFAAAIERAPG